MLQYNRPFNTSSTNEHRQARIFGGANFVLNGLVPEVSPGAAPP